MGGRTLEVRLKDKKTAFDTNIYIYGKRPFHTNIIHFHLYRDEVEEEWTPYWAASIINTDTEVLDYTIAYPTLYLWADQDGKELGTDINETEFRSIPPSTRTYLKIINSNVKLSEIPIVFTTGKAEYECGNTTITFNPLEVGEGGTIEGYLKCPLSDNSFKNLYFTIKCAPYASFLSSTIEIGASMLGRTYFCEVPETLQVYGIKYFETADIIEDGWTVKVNSPTNSIIEYLPIGCEIIEEQDNYPKVKVLVKCQLRLKSRIENGNYDNSELLIYPISTQHCYTGVLVTLLDSYWIDNNNESSIDGNKYYHNYTMESTSENTASAFMYIRHALTQWYNYKGVNSITVHSETLTEEVIEKSKPVLLKSSLKGGSLLYSTGKEFLKLKDSSVYHNVIQLFFEDIQFEEGSNEISGAIVTYPGSLYQDPDGAQYSDYEGGIIMNFTIKKK